MVESHEGFFESDIQDERLKGARKLVFKQGVINLFKAKKHDVVVSLDECTVRRDNVSRVGIWGGCWD